MSTKAEKPILQGQRIKTRKRDEKAKYDPSGFRDSILQGLNEAGGDLEAVSKFLDIAGSKLDYRQYGEALFDVLLAGGILAPGGSVAPDADPNKPYRTDMCLFRTLDDVEAIKAHAQVIIKLMRRYKYLEKMFEEEMKKILVFMKGFSEEEIVKLAKATSFWIMDGVLPPTVLIKLLQEHLVRDGTAATFIGEMFVFWKDVKDVPSLKNTLRKSGLDSRLMEFFPPNKRNDKYFQEFFEEKGLGEIVKFQKAQANKSSQRNLQRQLETMVNDGESAKEIIALMKDLSTKNSLNEQEVIAIIWGTVMGMIEWNKKEELVADQALKHLRQYSQLFGAFTSTARAELALLHKVQEFCYDNMNFMKVFHKIVLLLYKTEVLSEDVILKWYKEAHLAKGKSVFLEQMKKFIDWLQSAEEESESGEEEDED